MNDVVLYSSIMFWAGVLLTKAVFYFHEKSQQKKFYLVMSAAILQVLDSVYSSHMSTVEYGLSQLKKIETMEEEDLQKYLKKEGEKVLVFMEIYTLLFIRAVPEKGRKYINYRSWSEAQSIIKQMRGLIGNEKDKR